MVDGRTVIGPDTTVYPFTTIGLEPQDLKYAGEPSRLEIGRGNVIREHVTMHVGTRGGGMVTRIGDGGLFMVGVHVAHDCQIGDRVIMAHNAAIGGHVTIGDEAILGALAAVHQFVRIGARAIVGGMTAVDRDVIPYGSVKGASRHPVRTEPRGHAPARDGTFGHRGGRQMRSTCCSAARAPCASVSQCSRPPGRMIRGSSRILSFLRSDPSRPICQPAVSGTP